MITGIDTNKLFPYVLEDDRGSEIKTIFYVKAKTGHEANKSLQRYASASREKAGKRDISVQKLDAADVEEFINVVKKVENYGFPENSTYYKAETSGVVAVIEDVKMLEEVARTLSSAHLQEVLDATTNLVTLTDSLKKTSN